MSELFSSSEKKDEATTMPAVKTWLMTIQNFLFPYLKYVYFSIKGAK